MEEITNKVEQSGLLQISPEDYVPKESDIYFLDFKAFFLDPEMPIVREKELRKSLKETDWEAEIGEKNIICIVLDSSLILPGWIEALLTSHFCGITPNVHIGANKQETIQKAALFSLATDPDDLFEDKRVIVKGCSSFPIPDFFNHFIRKHQPAAKSIMYGEACSTVPIFKKR